MKNKEEQIQEMAQSVVCSAIVSNAKIDNKIAINLNKFVENMIKIGYRKASDVVSEFVKKLIDFPHWLENGTVLVIHMEELLEFAAEFGVEVEK